MSVTDRIRAIEKRSHSDRSTESVPAMRILGLLAERHFLALAEALEDHYAGHGELRAIEETLAGLETEPSG